MTHNIVTDAIKKHCFHLPDKVIDALIGFYYDNGANFILTDNIELAWEYADYYKSTRRIIYVDKNIGNLLKEISYFKYSDSTFFMCNTKIQEIENYIKLMSII